MRQLRSRMSSEPRRASKIIVESHQAFPFLSRQSAPTRVSSLVRYIRSRCAKTRLFSAARRRRGRRATKRVRPRRFRNIERAETLCRVRVGSLSSEKTRSLDLLERVQLVCRFSSLPTSGSRDSRRDVFPRRPSPCRSRIRTILPDARQTCPDPLLRFRSCSRSRFSMATT